MSCINVSEVDFWQEGKKKKPGAWPNSLRRYLCPGETKFMHKRAHIFLSASVSLSRPRSGQSPVLLLLYSKVKPHHLVTWSLFISRSSTNVILTKFAVRVGECCTLVKITPPRFFFPSGGNTGGPTSFFSLWLVIVNIPYLCFQIFIYHLRLY